MSTNLPVTQDESRAIVELPEERPPPEPRQNLAVALLPLALIAFLILSFVVAAWTFLAAG
ncbi:MAG: hypothetical protein M3R49_07115 [Chloroflexota bacterium]|nr:hypothetical protein [Chloroflexota bacterium]